MMNLAEYRRRSQSRSPTSCPGRRWSARASSSTRMARSSARRSFAGPISIRATPAELVAITGRLNNALRRLGSGWAIFVEAQRQPAHQLSRISTFPDAASALVDAERRAQFEEEGAHFESRYFLTFLYLPPADEAGASRSAGSTKGATQQVRADWRDVLAGFVDRTDRVLALVEGFMPEIRVAR